MTDSGEINIVVECEHPCCADADRTYAEMEQHLRAENDRLRARIHEAVDECQRRHAKYVARCDQFDTWSAWARRRFEEQGSDYWSMTSEADRLVILSIIEERDAAEARVRTQVAQELLRKLTMSTDGDQLDPDIELPVGEIRRVLAETIAFAPYVVQRRAAEPTGTPKEPTDG